MKKDKLSKIIEENCPDIKERKDKIWGKIALRTGYAQPKKRIVNFRAIFAVASAVLVICFLPVAISLSKVLTTRYDAAAPTDSGTINSKYDIHQRPVTMVTETATTTLSELSESDENIMFLKWEVLETVNYYQKGSDEISYMREDYNNKDKEIELSLYIAYPNKKIGFLENIQTLTSNSSVINDIKVNYLVYSDKSVAYFEYNNYIYCLYFANQYENEIVLSTVSELLDCKK